MTSLDFNFLGLITTKSFAQKILGWVAEKEFLQLSKANSILSGISE